MSSVEEDNEGTPPPSPPGVTAEEGEEEEVRSFEFSCTPMISHYMRSLVVNTNPRMKNPFRCSGQSLYQSECMLQYTPVYAFPHLIMVHIDVPE